MGKYPCYVCSDNCDDFCIYCETCKTWSHYRCQDIDRSDRDQWRHNIKLQFICLRCRSNDDGSYDYLMALERLHKASKNGLPKLLKAAEREKMFLKNVPLETSLHTDFKSHEQDQSANTLIAHFHTTNKTAINSTPDGDCFFNSVSTLLAGDESRSTELRYRCCLEMLLNKSNLMLHPQYKRLTILCPTLEKDCLTCAVPGTNSSMHMFIAMSRLLNLPINVIYPAVNGASTYNFKVMNTVLRPPFADPKKGSLNLMWTSMRVPVNPPTSAAPWNPNHIVPLVDNVARGSIQTMATFFQKVDENKENVNVPCVKTHNRYQHLKHEVLEDEVDDTDNGSDSETSNVIKQETKVSKRRNKRKPKSISSSTPEVGMHPVRDAAPCAPTHESTLAQHHNKRNKTKSFISSPKDNPQPITSMVSPEVGMHLVRDAAPSAPTNEFDTSPCHATSHFVSDLSIVNEIDEQNVSENRDQNDCENNETAFVSGPLGNKFMDLDCLIKILSGPYAVLDEVPIGRKDGNFYIIDNKNNNERRKKGQKSEFWDDCGAWSKGASPIFTFIERDNKLVTLHNRNGTYCLEKNKDKKKIYEPLEPQPLPNELLVIKRLYNTLTASENGPEQFKRRCTWILSTPQSMPQLSVDVALVEYIGKFPFRQPHGKSVENKEVYIRTKPNVRRKLKEQLKSQSVKSVENSMNKTTKDDFSKQRNEKQLRNIKYLVSRKQSDHVPSNAADQIIYVEEMVKTHPLVYSVKHVKGLQHPVITLCNEQQIMDLKRFCGTGRTVLGVDKTYNLGDFHVTPTVYKDLSVRRKSSKQHPITFGPTFIHTNSSAKTYSSFFHDIADNLQPDEINNLVIGSDEEKSFKVAIERCLHGSTHTLCTRHLRQNTNNYLEDHVGYTKPERIQLTDAIYGEDGLTFAKDIDTFDYRLDRIKEKIETFDGNCGDKKFMPYFTDKLLPMLKEFVIEPCNRGKIERGWTNNNCESGNHILKSATGWKHTEIPKFINLLDDIVGGERVERCRAIRGTGNYELDERYLHHKIDIDKWANLSEESKELREKKFLRDKGKETQNCVTSVNGLRTVLKTPNAGKKPNQVKRKQ